MPRNESGSRWLIWIASALFVLAVFFLTQGIIRAMDGKAEAENITRTEPAPKATVKPLTVALSSKNAMLLRLPDGAVLLDMGSEEKIYPASLTKIMTAVVALEELPDLDEEVLVTHQMLSDMLERNASMAGFRGGEKVKVIDLLYGVMLPSGGECTAALAQRAGGSNAGFVKLMNEKAAELGMENTHFTNPSGLHSDNHYTTCRDLATLLAYALENDIFRQIFTTHRYSTDATNAHDGGITFYSTLFEKLGEESVKGGEILGGKTGYTREAGLCLASLGRKGGEEYILITANAEGNPSTEQANILDAIAVYNAL